MKTIESIIAQLLINRIRERGPLNLNRHKTPATGVVPIKKNIA